MAEQESRLAIRIDSSQALANSKKLAQELDNITRSGNNVETQANAAGSALKNLAGYMAGVVTVGNAISKMDAYTSIQNRLKLVTKSQQELNQAMRDTFDIAWRSAQSWDAVTSVYTKYLSNAKTLKINQADVAKLTEITSKAVAMSGSTAEAAAGALFQYGQALDGGVLRAEEFNSLVDGAGGLLNAMSTGLKITRGELRQMMLDGKLTGDVITKALLTAGSSVETLYSQTDTTIKESFTLMNNALTQFVGESGKASGAASTLSSAIKTLAENLDLIAHIAILGGVAAITKAIVAQVVAMKAAIAVSVQRRAAAAAELQAQAQLAAMELQRSRQNVALAAQEVHLARLDYNAAISKQARAVAIQRLTAAEIAHNIAVSTNTKAVAANTAATVANNAAKTVGARLTGLAGAAFLGPAGIVMGVTALTAGYMLMRNSGNDANEMLQDQANYAGMAADELSRLSGNQAKAAKQDLSKSIDEQAQKLKEAKRAFEDFILSVYKEGNNKEVYRIWAEMTTNVLDTESAFRRLNAIDAIDSDAIKQASQYEKQYRNLNKTLIESKDKLKLIENSVDGAAKKAKAGAAEIKGLSGEIKKLLKEVDQDVVTAKVTAKLADMGASDKWIEIVNKWTKVEGAIVKNAEGRSVFRDDVKKKMYEEFEAFNAQEKAIESRNEKERERTKELEKQAKLVKSFTIDSLIARGEGGYNSVNLGAKHGYKSSTRNLTKMTVGEVMAAQDRREFNAAGRNQLIRTTMKEAVKALKIDTNALFDEKMQDRILRDYLLDIKNPQIKNFITGKGQLAGALNALPREFASFGVAYDMQGGSRRVKKGESYYANVANNKASISSEEAANALLATKKVYQENLAAGMSAQEAWENAFSKQREVVGYTKSNALDLDRMLDDIAQATADREQAQAEERKRIANEVANYEVQVKSRLADQLKAVDAAGFSEAETIKAKNFYENRANLEIQSFKDAQQAKINALKEFQLTEDQLINKQASDRDRELKRQQELGEITLEQYMEGSLLIEQRRQKEIRDLSAAQAQRVSSYKQVYSKEQEAALDRYLTELEQIRLIQNELERNEALRALSFESMRGGVGQQDQFLSAPYASKPQTNTGALDYEYQDQLQRMQAFHMLQVAAAQNNSAELLVIEEEYLSAKSQLQDEYNAKAVVARQADHEAQLNMYGAMLSQAGSVWGDMTQIVRDSAGEQSGAYKAMFLMQQMFAMGSAMVSTHLASAQALADPSALTFAQKAAYASMITAMGYANVGMIAAQTIAGLSGFKDGGLITGAGTGTSDSILIRASNEEFMMRHAAVKSIGVDNLNYMNKYGKLPEQTKRVGSDLANTMVSQPVNVSVEPKININVPEGYTAQQSRDANGDINIDILDRQMARLLGNQNSQTGMALKRNYKTEANR